MSDYTKLTDFTAKDSLVSGDPSKVVRGSEIDDEFDAIATAIASKANSSDLTSKVDVAGGTMTGALVLNAAPTADLHASTKKYVDDGLATKAGTSHTHDWSVLSSRLFAEGALTESADAFNYPVLLTNVGTPDANYWFVTTTRRDVSDVGQTAVGLGTGRMYTRSKQSGSWTAWVRCDLGEGLTRSIGASGYVTIPGAGGLILQWGRFTRTTSTQNVSFPMTFPNACLSVVQSDMRAAELNDSSRTTAIYASYFTSSRADATSFDVLYQAIGY